MPLYNPSNSLGARLLLTNIAATLNPSTSNAGTYTEGQTFSVNKNATCTGVSFYWVSAAADFTIKVSIWNAAGTLLGSGTVSVNATGVYTANFSSSVALTAGNIYTLGLYNNTTTTRRTIGTQATLNTLFPARPANVGGYVMVSNCSIFANGDAKPSLTDASEVYIIDPIITIP